MEASSFQRPMNDTRAIRGAWIVSSGFKYLCTDSEKKETTKIEDVVRAQRHNTTDEEVIIEEVKGWVDDPLYSRTPETKYFKLAETYWIVKVTVAQAVEKTRKVNESTLHKVKILEGKFELFCQSHFGIKFRVTPEGKNEEQHQTASVDSSSYGSKNQPIPIDDVEEARAAEAATKLEQSQKEAKAIWV